MRTFYIPTPAQRCLMQQRTYDMALGKARELGYGWAAAANLARTATDFQRQTGAMPSQAIEACIHPKECTLAGVDAAIRKAWDDAMGYRPA